MLWVCDRVNDCGDWSDEQECGKLRTLAARGTFQPLRPLKNLPLSLTLLPSPPPRLRGQRVQLWRQRLHATGRGVRWQDGL